MSKVTNTFWSPIVRHNGTGATRVEAYYSDALDAMFLTEESLEAAKAVAKRFKYEYHTVVGFAKITLKKELRCY